jgi:hypothetical protein
VIESLSPEGRLLFAARAVRSFAFGFTATMVEDVLLTMLLSS